MTARCKPMYVYLAHHHGSMNFFYVSMAKMGCAQGIHVCISTHKQVTHIHIWESISEEHFLCVQLLGRFEYAYVWAIQYGQTCFLGFTGVSQEHRHVSMPGCKKPERKLNASTSREISVPCRNIRSSRNDDGTIVGGERSA
jgi:hypothetical protein